MAYNYVTVMHVHAIRSRLVEHIDQNGVKYYVLGLMVIANDGSITDISLHSESESQDVLIPIKEEGSL